MSKERLEELKEKYNYERLGVFIDLKPVDQQDLKWLFEQAERVQELEKEVEKWRSGRFISTSTKRKIDKLEEQNKRYREALKFYADERNHEYDITYDMADVIESEVMKDYGKKARQALEGESDV